MNIEQHQGSFKVAIDGQRVCAFNLVPENAPASDMARVSLYVAESLSYGADTSVLTFSILFISSAWISPFCFFRKRSSATGSRLSRFCRFGSSDDQQWRGAIVVAKAPIKAKERIWLLAAWSPKLRDKDVSEH